MHKRGIGPAVLALVVAACSGDSAQQEALVPVPGPATERACMASLTENPWRERRPLNIAHRGGVIEFPENTLFGFQRALEVGAHMLEMDIWQTADGELVVIHDATVDRTTDGSGNVSEMTLAELKMLDNAFYHVPGRGTRGDATVDEAVYRGVAIGDRPPPPGFEANDFTIPTVREVLERFPDAFLTIELKPDTDAYGSFEPALAALLEEFGRGEDVVVASFDDGPMFRFKRSNQCATTSSPLIQAGVFVATGFGPLPGIMLGNHQVFQVPIGFEGIPVVTPNFIDNAHRQDMAVQVWTINDCATMQELLDMGVDGILTDRPAMLNFLLREGHCPDA